MGKHSKLSTVQSWSSFIAIFAFALVLGAVGTVVKIQGGNVPDIINAAPPRTQNAPAPTTVPPLPTITTIRPSSPSVTGSANKPELNAFVIPVTQVPVPTTPSGTTTTQKPKPPTVLPTKAEVEIKVSASLTNTFDLLAQCESSGDWNINTGNSYYGGLQKSLGTWKAYGGTSYASRPDLATEEEQKLIAAKIQNGQGWNAWPTCSAKLGLL